MEEYESPPDDEDTDSALKRVLKSGELMLRRMDAAAAYHSGRYDMETKFSGTNRYYPSRSDGFEDITVKREWISFHFTPEDIALSQEDRLLLQTIQEQAATTRQQLWALENLIRDAWCENPYTKLFWKPRNFYRESKRLNAATAIAERLFQKLQKIERDAVTRIFGHPLHLTPPVDGEEAINGIRTIMRRTLRMKNVVAVIEKNPARVRERPSTILNVEELPKH